jgi:hypothetical protein
MNNMDETDPLLTSISLFTFDDEQNKIVDDHMFDKNKSKTLYVKRRQNIPSTSQQTTRMTSMCIAQRTQTLSAAIDRMNDKTTTNDVQTTCAQQVDITVDTSKAGSNRAVVRSCLRQLGWKEVRIIHCVWFTFASCHIEIYSLLISSERQVLDSIQQPIYSGIRHHSMKTTTIQCCIIVV